MNNPRNQRDQLKTSVVLARLVILFLSPIGALGCVTEPMGTGCSFFPAGAPKGTDLMSYISLFPVKSEMSASRWLCLPYASRLVACLAYSSTLKTEANVSLKRRLTFN
jgi:hypothetical protein